MNSQHVLKVYDFGVHNRQSYMVMERIEGKFLSEILEKGPLPPDQVIMHMRGIVEGLAEMHHAGVVHGDVMPRNILIHADGLPRITDFGLARYEGEQGEHMDHWSSPYYMPPERVLGEKEDFRGDFYSLGTTLYIMVTGMLPYFDMDEEVVKQSKVKDPVRDPREIQPGINDALVELIGVLLHRHPEDRPSSYEELTELVENVAEFLPKPSPRKTLMPGPLPAPPAPEPKKKIKKRHTMFWFLFFSVTAFIFYTVVSWRAAALEENKQIHDAPTPTPFPTSTPAPTPTPTPAPTPTPIPPTPIPVPLPTPTPTPRPLGIDDIRTPLVRLETQNAISEGLVATWVMRNRVGFRQSNPHKQPIMIMRRDMAPMLRFDNDLMISALTPHWEEEFTLILVADPIDKPGAPSKQALIGVHPKAEGSSTFSMMRETNIPGSFLINTERGSARLTLPKEDRDQPVILAFRKKGDREEGFLNLRRTLLSTKGTRPEPDNQRLPGLQLGGFGTPGYEYYGWIGAVMIYERALSEKELLAVFSHLRKEFSIDL